MYDIGWNFMQKTNGNICIEENAKVTQHDTEFENANDEDHIEAPHCHILAVNVVKNLVFFRSDIYL